MIETVKALLDALDEHRLELGCESYHRGANFDAAMGPKIEAVKAALSAQSTGSGGAAAEPVAWAYEWRQSDIGRWRQAASEAKPCAEPNVRNIRPLYEHPPVAAEPEEWLEDPSADARWNAGLDYALVQLCRKLDVETHAVCWDAATETVDGDVRSVIGNILTLWAGDDWMDAPARLAAAPTPPAGGGETEAKPYDPVRGRMAKGCCSAVSPCSHQQRDPTTLCEICQKAARLTDKILAAEPCFADESEAAELAASERISAAQAAYDYAMADYDPTAPDHEVHLFDAMKAAIAVADAYAPKPSPASPAGDLNSLSAGKGTAKSAICLEDWITCTWPNCRDTCQNVDAPPYLMGTAPAAPRKGPSEEEIARKAASDKATDIMEAITSRDSRWFSNEEWNRGHKLITAALLTPADRGETQAVGDGWSTDMEAGKREPEVDLFLKGYLSPSRACQYFWDPEQRGGGEWVKVQDRHKDWRDRQMMPSNFVTHWRKPPAPPASTTDQNRGEPDQGGEAR